MLALTGWIENVDDPTHAPQLARLLQSFVENNHEHSLRHRRQQASQRTIRRQLQRRPGSFRRWRAANAPSPPAFRASNFVSEPFALGKDNRPALVVSVPLFADGQFTGMLAAVVSIDRLLERLRDASVRDRTVFIVDGHGHIVALSRRRANSSRAATSPPLPRSSSHLNELPQELRATRNHAFRRAGQRTAAPSK